MNLWCGKARKHGRHSWVHKAKGIVWCNGSF